MRSRAFARDDPANLAIGGINIDIGRIKLAAGSFEKSLEIPNARHLDRADAQNKFS